MGKLYYETQAHAHAHAGRISFASSHAHARAHARAHGRAHAPSTLTGAPTPTVRLGMKGTKRLSQP